VVQGSSGFDMKKIQLFSIVAALGLSAWAFADDNDGDNKPSPSSDGVSVSASDPIAFRGLSSGAFILHRPDTNGDLAISIALSGTASNGVDYATLPGTVTIPAGFHAVGLTVSPLGGGSSSPDEWVTLTIVSNANYQVGRPSHASVLIKANAFENQAPTVAITSPTDNSSIAAHANLTISADANDPNDSIAKVSFFANDKSLGSSTTAPYSLIWSNVPAGTYALFARAEDQFGKSTLSTAVHLSVTNPPTGTASVVLTSPTAGSSFDAGSDIPLAATVTSTAAITSVSFYSGDKLLGSDDTAPYTFTWSNVSPGSYSLRAKATDANGAVSVSPQVKITVSNAPPKVSITSPANNAVIAGPANVTISADASDADGGVVGVTFFGDAKSLGTVKTAPYSLIWSNVPPGKHVIIAKATDAYGAYGAAAVEFTISNTPPTVTLTAPANNAVFTAPATIQLAADAADADGIAYVSFWAGDRLLGSVKTAPYTLTVSKVMQGTYTFRAHAVDANGQVTVSAPVKVTVVKVPHGGTTGGTTGSTTGATTGATTGGTTGTTGATTGGTTGVTTGGATGTTGATTGGTTGTTTTGTTAGTTTGGTTGVTTGGTTGTTGDTTGGTTGSTTGTTTGGTTGVTTGGTTGTTGDTTGGTTGTTSGTTGTTGSTTGTTGSTGDTTTGGTTGTVTPTRI
jgi:hypothetical protein